VPEGARIESQRSAVAVGEKAQGLWTAAFHSMGVQRWCSDRRPWYLHDLTRRSEGDRIPDARKETLMRTAVCSVLSHRHQPRRPAPARPGQASTQDCYRTRNCELATSRLGRSVELLEKTCSNRIERCVQGPAGGGPRRNVCSLIYQRSAARQQLLASAAMRWRRHYASLEVDNSNRLPSELLFVHRNDRNCRLHCAAMKRW
jgi:hypothetical protein